MFLQFELWCSNTPLCIFLRWPLGPSYFFLGEQVSIVIKHQDCLEFLASLQDNSVDLVILDPPYNIGFDKNQGWDSQWDSTESYLEWCAKWTAECFRVLKANKCFYVWGTTKTDTFLHYKLSVLNNIPNAYYQNWIIWAYDWGGRTKKTFPRKHEDLLMYSKGSSFPFYPENVFVPRVLEENINIARKIRLLVKRVNNIAFTEKDEHSWTQYKYHLKTEDELAKELLSLNDKNLKFKAGKIPTDVWHKNNHTTSAEYCNWHPTQKPISLLERIIKAHTVPGDVILDVFGGTASTAIAAQNTGRNAWISEFDSTFHTKSIEHFRSMTNQIPLLDFPSSEE